MKFDETTFPYKKSTHKVDPSYDFLTTEKEPSALFRSIFETPSVPQPAMPNLTAVAPTQETQAPPEEPRHTMTTRSKHGIHKPRQILSLLAQTQSPLPKSHLKALDDPN